MSQVVLITGASSGIGKKSALLLAERGYIVYAGTRTPEKFDTDIKNLHVIKLDITDNQSIQRKIGLPLLSFYNSSKYAVEGITDSLRYELKDFNIRVHSIMPGFFSTNFAKDNLVDSNMILRS